MPITIVQGMEIPKERMTNCQSCEFSGRPSYEWPCTNCNNYNKFLLIQQRSKPNSMNKVEAHGNLCDFIHNLYTRKNHDYGDSFSRTYESLGIISAATRITDKYNRFIEMAKGSKQLVNDESIRDTLIDMANYCLMTIMELDREAANETEDVASGT